MSDSKNAEFNVDETPIPPETAKGATRRAADSAERAYLVIRDLLIEFKIHPDARVNEVKLARLLQYSRTPVREALNRLAMEGFLVFKPNRGYFARGLEVDDLIELFELRSIIETGAFVLACERASQQAIDQIRQFWTEMRPRYDDSSRDTIVMIDEAFHEKIAELTGNDSVVRQLRNVNSRVRFVRRILFQLVPRNEKLIDDHWNIIEALEARDSARGAEVLREHISLTFTKAKSVLTAAVAEMNTRDGNARDRE